MTETFTTEYLERLTELQGPPFLTRGGTEILTHEESQVLYDYANLRNAARDLLRNSNDKRAESILSELVTKLGLTFD